MFLTRAVADMVVLGSEGFYFLISSIMFLFLSPLVVSQFRQEEWLPGGPCSVTGRCMMRVVCGRAVHTQVESVGCSVETPYPEERGPCICMGMVGEGQTTGVLVGFSLFTVGIVAG